MPDLRIPALAFDQGAAGALYAFAVEGRRLGEFATIARVRRDDTGDLLGYQRPEIRRHVASIRSYLESDAPRLPNALVVAFDERVRFEPDPDSTGNLEVGEGGQPGILVVPVDPATPNHAKPGWVVDGQQRMMALQDADPSRLDGPFPICVVAFVAATEAEQREQFILVNATKPLPKSLVYELLPVTDGPLPPALAARRFPATLLDRLNRDLASPFAGRVKTPTNPDGDIKDNSVLRMIEHSLSDGALYRYRGPDADDAAGMLRTLYAYWGAVAAVFPAAWSAPPAHSRLTHGAGLVAMGYVMDAVTHCLGDRRSWTRRRFEAELGALAPHCHWTTGVWDFGPDQRRRWNEVQNVGSDIHLLTYHLLHTYRSVGSALPLRSSPELSQLAAKAPAGAGVPLADAVFPA